MISYCDCPYTQPIHTKLLARSFSGQYMLPAQRLCRYAAMAPDMPNSTAKTKEIKNLRRRDRGRGTTIHRASQIDGENVKKKKKKKKKKEECVSK
jgi:hypothetical protein